jgi:hypothetical protein
MIRRPFGPSLLNRTSAWCIWRGKNRKGVDMTTATLQRTDQQRGLRALALLLVFGIGMTLGLVLPLNRSQAQVATPPASAAQVAVPAAPAPSIAVAATGLDSVAAYTAATRNYAAAVAAHDYPSAAGFRQRIEAMTTPAVVADVYSRYQDLRASISTAGLQHEIRLQHAFQAQLTELCAGPGFLASFPGCQTAAK